MNPPAEREPRATVRMVARKAGVSPMTVSRVLRGGRHVAAVTRARVLGAARLLAYQPDPQVAKLMHHLRSRRKPHLVSSICALTTVPPEDRPLFTQELIRGAKERAEARGFGFEVMLLEVKGGRRRDLQRVLQTRGVEGVLLLPMAECVDLGTLFDWEEFSVVAATTSVITPDVHRVIPNHYQNMLLLCRQLDARGYRRIGLVLPEDYVLRVNHAFNAAVAWHGLYYHQGFVPPLIFSGAMPRRLTEWFARERPDVIVTNSPRRVREYARMLRLSIPGGVGFAMTHVPDPNLRLAGVDERPFAIGGAAIDLLGGMIRQGEKGLPREPAATLMLGRWLDYRSCPTRKVTASDKETARAAKREGAELVYRDDDRLNGHP